MLQSHLGQFKQSGTGDVVAASDAGTAPLVPTYALDAELLLNTQNKTVPIFHTHEMHRDENGISSPNSLYNSL